jgi:hypothetical protein
MLASAAVHDIVSKTSTAINVKIGAVTFGAPNIAIKVTAEKLTRDYFKGFGNIIRFEDTQDPIPMAVFWKDNPGIRITLDYGLFYDATGTLQAMGRNPHNMDQYYHAVGEGFKSWKDKTAEIRHLILRREGCKIGLKVAREQLRNESEDLAQKAWKAVNADHDNSPLLYKEGEKVRPQLEEELRQKIRKATDLKAELNRRLQANGSIMTTSITNKQQLSNQMSKDIDEAYETLKIIDQLMTKWNEKNINDGQRFAAQLNTSIARLNDLLAMLGNNGPNPRKAVG